MSKDTNSGYRNSGYRNSGNCNSGDFNSGNCNSGGYNSGDFNSGNFNSGYRNSGDFNSGYRNSGGYNSGDFNSGLFNTDEPNMRMFNKETNIKYTDFVDSDDYIYFEIPLNKFILSSDMSDKEKEEHDEYKTCGGYLKTLEYKEAWNEWWKENRSVEMIKKIKKLPNFDASIFEEITGIKIDTEEKLEISMNEIAEKFGVDVSKLKIKK